MKPAKTFLFYIVLLLFNSCTKDEPLIIKEDPQVKETEQGDTVTIFFVNDPHGQLDNFAKIKHLVDKEKEENKVLLVCAGDIFSGNPIVDQYPDKGYPIVDIMNRTGFDVAVIGNHEYDYGVPVLKERMAQAEFDFICANVNTGESGLPQPEPFKTFVLDSLKVTFLGLVETNGKPDDVIPSTHPWRVRGLEFQRFTNVVNDFQNLKEEEESDLLIALTHLGTRDDLALAEQNPGFDLVIGGHSHQMVKEEVNGTPVVQAGSDLSHLGKLELIVKDKEVVSADLSFINLENYSGYDQELMQLIETYNNNPEFEEVVGYSHTYHDRAEVGCFYTTALKEYLQVDVSFQNSGGIRADIDQGDITRMEVYNMDPFNNRSVVFTMTVDEIRNFFIETGAGFHVEGINLEWSGNNLIISDENGQILPGTEVLEVGMNDYIPAVYEAYFPLEKADIRSVTTAESIIAYLESMNKNVEYPECNNYFR